MKSVVKNKHVHVLILMSAFVFGVYAYFFALPTGQAVSNEPLGSLTAELKPLPGSQSVEQFTVTFDAYAAGVGNQNLNGWTLQNDDGVIYTFSGVTLEDTDEYTVCASAASGCDDTWSGGDVWDDTTDTMKLIDEDGGNLVNRSYNNPGEDELVIEIVEVGVPVYSKNDKVLLCHEDNKDVLGAKSVPVGPFIKGVLTDRNNGHHADLNDIIPSFYYDLGDGLAYYAGHNWPEQKAILDNNCQ